MNYSERLAAAQEMNARPVGEDHPKQKFPRGTRVRITGTENRELESGGVILGCMRGDDCEAIIDYSYAQKYGDGEAEGHHLEDDEEEDDDELRDDPVQEDHNAKSG